MASEKSSFLEDLTDAKVIVAGALVLLTTGFFILRPALKSIYKKTNDSSTSTSSSYTKKSVVKELRKENPTKKNIPTLDGKAVVEAIKICKVPVLKITANGTNRNNNTVGIYCHGGKYVSGCAESCAEFALELSNRLNMPIYVPNYRLLPENSLEDALDDMVDVLQGIGRNKLYVLGGSGSGANLAFRAVRVAQKKKLRPPQALFSISGALDGTYTLEPTGPKESALVSIYNDSFEDEKEMSEELQVYKYDLSNFPYVWLCWDQDEKFNFEANRSLVSSLKEVGAKYHVEETKGLFENTPQYFSENILESKALLDSLTKHVIASS